MKNFKSQSKELLLFYIVCGTEKPVKGQVKEKKEEVGS